MSRKSQIKQVLDTWSEWFHQAQQRAIMRGQISHQLSSDLALALIGVRRCGKSYTAVQVLKDITEPVLYLNFEDPFFVEHYDVTILEEFVSIFTEYNKKSPKILVLDEIHQLTAWERWVRKEIDLKRYQILVTGSSAKLLSSELATSLTGRTLTETIWPLSFKEFLLFSQRSCSNSDEYLGAMRDYFLWGGFPEITLLKDEAVKKKLLQQYLSDILYKDIILRYELRSARNLEQLVRYYLTNLSSLHSYNSVRKALELNTETSKDYTHYLQETFLIFEVQRFHHNMKVQIRDQKKIYAIDTGLRNCNTASVSEDIGKLAENVVYLELRRRNHDISYYKLTGEVDFLITKFGKPEQAIQVCYDDLAEELTWNREVNSLLECLNDLGLPEGFILTRQREEQLSQGGKKIHFIPLYKWLLQ